MFIRILGTSARLPIHKWNKWPLGRGADDGEIDDDDAADDNGDGDGDDEDDDDADDDEMMMVDDG